METPSGAQTANSERDSPNEELPSSTEFTDEVTAGIGMGGAYLMTLKINYILRTSDHQRLIPLCSIILSCSLVSFLATTKLRTLVRAALANGVFYNACALADKLVSMSAGKPDDVLLLARTYVSMGDHRQVSIQPSCLWLKILSIGSFFIWHRLR
jgi:hypothetical protein